MKVKIMAVIAVFALCFLMTSAFADESKDKMEQDAMMKKWQEYATPGAPHKMMSNLVGTWETTVKDYTNPSGPTETKGTSTFAPLMDGRYLQETAEGTFNGMSFHGMGVYGYDNAMKKYVGSWVDNFGTGMMSSTGSSDDDGKTINWSGHGTDMSGKGMTFRSVMHRMSDDQYHFEMYGPGPDGKEARMMEITYNRKK